MINPLACAYKADRFKPQFAYPTPDGFRDEPYIVPFTFSVPADGLVHSGLPWRLDDDVPFILRGIIFPAIGTAQPGANTLPPTGFPALVRITDTQGNPLSDGLVLALGIWGQSGLNIAPGTNGFGFPVEPELVNAPGGSVLFDFAVQTNAVAASFAWTVGGSTINFVARIYGIAGNAYTINIIDPGAPNVALSVAVVGTAVAVTLATNGASVVISTMADVTAAVNGSGAALALIGAVLTAGGADVAAALAITALAGGAAASGNVTVTGTMLGVKRFSEC